MYSINNLMSRDTRNTRNKMSNKKDFRNQDKLKKRKYNHSDDDNHSSDNSSDGEMNMHEFRKYVQRIFPSKHMNKKISAGENLQKHSNKIIQHNNKDNKHHKNKKYIHDIDSEEEEEEEEWETSSNSDEEDTRRKKTYKNNKSKKKRKITLEDLYDSDYNSEDDSDYIDDEDDETEDDDSEYIDDDETEQSENTLDDDDQDDDESETEESDTSSENSKQKKKHRKYKSRRRRLSEVTDDEEEKPSKFNIIFTIGNPLKDGEDDDEDDDEDELYDSEMENSDYETEDEDEDVSTDDNSSVESSERKRKSSKQKKMKTQEKKQTEIKEKKHENDTEEQKDDENNNKIIDCENLIQLKNMLKLNPKDKYIKQCIKLYEDNLKKDEKNKEKKEKKQKAKNLRIFKKILHDKHTLDEYAFYEKLEVNNQKKLIKELKEINKITRIEKPYKMTLLENDIPVHFKAAAMKKINSIRRMDPGSGEYYKIKNWIDTFMKIPFTEYKELPINIDNGVEQCHEFMANAQKTLDDAVYGLNDAKMQIMQMLGQLLINPKSIGTAIAIHGPPGTGKTSLVKEGISKILNRPFAFIALGGATDSSFLEGHGYTYEGSTWGKIVQILINSKCMNPVIYFDELDKISDTPRGEEIAGILTHLTDTTQNSQFHDKYFAEIDFDLSKCLFIFSYNDETKVNPILKDRMYRIKTKGYSGKEKNVIANKYLLPKIREQVKFNNEDIIIPDDVLGYINDLYCQREDGVRNMKRCLEIIHTKLNLYRLMKQDTNLFENEMSLKVEFPFTITREIVGKLVKRESDGMETWRALYN